MHQYNPAAMLLDFTGTEVELPRELLHEVLPQPRIGGRAHQRGQLEAGAAPLGRIRRKIGEKEFEEWGRPFEEVAKCLLAAFTYQIIGIHPRRQHQNRNLDAGLEEHSGADRSCSATGGIGVVTEDDEPVGAEAPFEQTRMVRGQGGAESRHRILYPHPVQRQTIEVAFDNQRPPLVSHPPPRTVKAEECRPLPENRALRAVEVLGFAVVEDSAAKGDEGSVTGADGEGETVTEAIVGRRAAFGPHGQTTLDQRSLGMASGHVVDQAAPFVGRKTESVVAPPIFGKPASLELVPRHRSLSLLETFAEEMLRLFEQGSLPIALLPAPPRLGTSRREMNAIAPRKALHRFRKAEVLELHEELEDVAALVTSETVIQSLLGIDRERRGLLLVERAQTFPAAAPLFQTNVVANNLDKVRRLTDASDDITVQVSIYHSGSFSHRGRGA